MALRLYMNFKGVVPETIMGEGGDFYSFMAAHRIATGHSPYSVALVHKGYGYVYSPFIALVLVPVRHLSVKLLWRSWTVLSIAALVVGGGFMARYGSPQKVRRWHRPVFFAFARATALDFGPTKWELYNGQTDTFVPLLLIVSSLCAEVDRPALSGVLIGAGAVLKSWPGAVGLALLRRGQRHRRRAVAGFLAATLMAPVLVLIFEGVSGLVTFVKVTFAGSSQPDPSYSVWGTPKVLFSASRLARPLVVSDALRYGSTVVLVLIVVVLLWLALRSSHDSLLGYWNIVGGVVVLLPVSHLAYTLYFLPLLWIWMLRALSSPSLDRTSLSMTILMLVWWCFMYRYGWVEWPSESALHYMSPFFADLAIFAASTLCNRGGRRPKEVSIDPTVDAVPLATQ